MTLAARVQAIAVYTTILLLAAAALGYFVSPAAMLSVVGIPGTGTEEFLVRTLAAGFVGTLPMAWTVRKRSGTPQERAVLAGLAIYMIASSGVDLWAYVAGLVGIASVPSVAFRIALGGVLAGLALWPAAQHGIAEATPD